MYLGTSLPLRLVAFQSPNLVPGETYYWRIDEVNGNGTRRGFTWRFTTQ